MLLLLAAGALAALLPAAPSRAQSDLVFGVNEGVTYRITPHETRERYRELAETLRKTLKRTVKIVPVDEYPVLRKSLESKAYDLAYVHPSHHALRAMRDQQYRIVAVTRGFTEYRASFLIKPDAALARPEQVRGRAMVMPDPDSITAWMTRATLRELGMDPIREKLGTTRYQDGIPFMMEHGFYEIGITAANAVVKEWQSKGGKILFQSRPVPIKLLIASPEVPDADFARIQQFFLELDRSEQGRAILGQIGFKGFDLADEKLLGTLTHWLGI